LECVGVERFLRFSRKRQDGSAPIFTVFEKALSSLQPYEFESTALGV